MVDGRLYRDGLPLVIPKGHLFLALARAGWKGEDGPLSTDFVRRLRSLDRRMSMLYLRGDLESAA
jgi:hypothetical protein